MPGPVTLSLRHRLPWVRRNMPGYDPPRHAGCIQTMKLAAVTMVYNEAHLLPIWARHYTRHVGARHCYVIDHGSEDGSTADLGAMNVVPVVRWPTDEERRAAFISRVCAELLGRYDGVLHTDVDELLVPDPGLFADLPAWAAATPHDVVTAVGLNVIAVAEEAPIDPLRPISRQRRYVAFSSALCKPVYARRAVRWAPGLHSADAPVVFDSLFLFHLRYCDRAQALARLARTRAMSWASEQAGAHARVSDAEFISLLDNFAAMPRREHVAFDASLPPMADWLRKVQASQQGREFETYRIDLQINAYELWPLPPRFDGTF
ncbi:MAG: glycosyltransferase family 2 protein [Acidisphaera sp.]|nr:glycosyltransferase family 2 protein [Acidisphaera sp.]